MAEVVKNRPITENHGMLIAVLAIATGIVVFFTAVPLLLLSDKSVVWAPILAFGAAAGIVAFSNTYVGLCFAAFAIAPLGIVQHEIASVTLNLPEIVILALFAKELVIFILHGERPSLDLPYWALSLYLVAAAIGLFTGLQHGNVPHLVLQDCRQFTEYICLYLLVLHRVHTRRHIRQILICFLLGMTLVAIHGIIQRFTGIGLAETQIVSDMVYHQGIRSGSFYGATPLGGMMVLALGTSCALGLSAVSASRKFFFGGITAICMVAAVFTNTRASWFAIALMLVLVFFNIRKTKGIIALAVIGGLVFTAALGPIVAHRMAKLEVSKRERSLLQRITYYTAAWHMFRAYPVTGLGWGCQFNVDAIVRNGHYVPSPAHHHILNRRPMYESTVHSAYLQLLVKTGFIGLMAFLIFLGNWLGRTVLARLTLHRTEVDYNLFVGASAGIIGYLVHSGLENFFQWPVMSQSFWLLLGLTTVMAGQLRRQSTLDLDLSPETEVIQSKLLPEV